jgi:hypothetical protein
MDYCEHASFGLVPSAEVSSLNWDFPLLVMRPSYRKSAGDVLQKIGAELKKLWNSETATS